MTLRDLFDNEQQQDDMTNQNLLTGGEEDGEQSEYPPQEQDDGMNANYSQDLSNPRQDFRYIDRFVRIKGMPQPAKNTNEESNFLLTNDFAEQLILNFLNDKDQRHIWRTLCDIVDESEGSGNAQVALTDAKLLASRILMKRSSTENTLALNERTAHIEQRSRQNITTKSNQIQAPANGGWLSRLFGK